MSVKRIVFTGGPCAGKTTLIGKTEEYLKEKGYKVIVVQETATHLLKSRINADLLGNPIAFQKFILEFQLFNENLAEEVMEISPNDNFVILYDRGTLDNKAYFDDYNNFDLIVDNANISELDYLDKYDLVLDLITTADCAPEKYTLLTNDQRTESIEEAKILDKKTSNAWAGHRNMKIINSNISIDEAFEIIKKELNGLLKGRTKKEIKKREIYNSIEDFKNYNDNNSRLIKTQELVLNKENDNIKYVLYKRMYKGENSYILKVYKEENGIQTIYCDKKIPFDYYLDLITRYKIKCENYYEELSFVENRQEYKIKFYDNVTMLEYEKNKLNDEFVLPEVIKIIKNKNLLKKKKHDNIN